MKFVVFLIFSVILITSADELRKFALILSGIYTKTCHNNSERFPNLPSKGSGFQQVFRKSPRKCISVFKKW